MTEHSEDSFRRHYQRTYAQGGYPYERYENAYRYGYAMGQVWEQPEQDWMLARPEARRGWMARREQPWEEVEEAVRTGWEQAIKELDRN